MRSMRLRAFLSDTPTGRALSILVLALFVLLCGLHIAGAHHDSHGDSFALAGDAFVLLVLVGLLILLAFSRPPLQAFLIPTVRPRAAPPSAATASDLVRRETPLLC